MTVHLIKPFPDSSVTVCCGLRVVTQLPAGDEVTMTPGAEDCEGLTD